MKQRGSNLSNVATTDYIVVGSGSAGSVVANRLSEDGRSQVALLEAGGTDRHPWIIIPGGVELALQNPRFDWGYRSEPDPTRGGMVDPVPRGRLLGGSSSINGMAFVRGDPCDFDAWAAAGADGWSFSDMLPVFKRIERTAIGRSDSRGRDGPVEIIESWGLPHLAETFAAACEQTQIHRNPDYNGGDQFGFGPTQANIARGTRHSSARAYLKPIRRRQNLRVIGSAHASRILFERGRAVGVEYYVGTEKRILRCRCEIIVAAGAINTPQLLMLSGIGPAEMLTRHGISIAGNSPWVGRNLMDHAGMRIARAVNVPTLNREALPLRRLVNGLRWMLTRSGPAAAIYAQMFAFIRTLPDLPSPDVQLHFEPLLYDYADGIARVSRRNGISIGMNVSRPKSRGVLSLASASFRDHPKIQPMMFDDLDDLETLVRAVRIVEQLLGTSAMRKIVVPRAEDPSWPTDTELRDAVRSGAHGVYHPAGTARIGRSISDGVVDARLRVHGVQGLRVADLSVTPSLVSGNTNAVAMAIGEKAADMTRKDRAI